MKDSLPPCDWLEITVSNFRFESRDALTIRVPLERAWEPLTSYHQDVVEGHCHHQDTEQSYLLMVSHDCIGLYAVRTVPP